MLIFLDLQASAGWDPGRLLQAFQIKTILFSVLILIVTGLGTPNFAKLKTIVTS